ncbi:MAG: AAA family ATPase [Candidatus Sumerlaeota bacterium]|nr:AAA family ATPase [Candidatus Sumerlaeota bacterium]
MSVELKSISILGYKSYRNLEYFEPGRLSVLIGANGAGKSNLISFFRLLYSMMASPGELQLAVESAGGAGKLLHEGSKVTDAIGTRLALATEAGMKEYKMRLAYAAPDRLIFTEERCQNLKAGRRKPKEFVFGTAHRESMLVETVFAGSKKPVADIRNFLRNCIAYQFHDTSFTAKLRGRTALSDGRHLHSDASNLAAFLYRLKQGGARDRQAFKRIQDTARLALPFLGEIILEPANGGSILLQWRERGSETIFDASQASDGMLRILALVSLLCQPSRDLPALLILDEPELGLHPQAISLIASLIRQASAHAQVLAATQSVPFVDEFKIDEIVVISRPGRESSLRRLNEKEFEQWLKDYSTGELWRKNVYGGGPGE